MVRREPAPYSATSFALLHSASYDAVVSVADGGHPYLLSERGPRGARPDAAAAGHDTLAAQYPGATGVREELLAAEVTAMPDGPAKTDGVRVGQDIAARLLTARADDGSAASGPPVAAGTTPAPLRRSRPRPRRRRDRLLRRQVPLRPLAPGERHPRGRRGPSEAVADNVPIPAGPVEAEEAAALRAAIELRTVGACSHQGCLLQLNEVAKRLDRPPEV